VLRLGAKERRSPRYASLADEDLMLRAAAGDARAFGVIFDRHGGVAFSLAFRMCGGKAPAEDIVQEAFVSLWRSSAQYDPGRGSVRSWVLTMVHNRAIDGFRRDALRDGKRVADDGLTERLEADERTEVEAERREQSRVVRSALRSLPDEQRQVLELAYFGGFTHTEIAELLTLPQGTVKGRMRLGMAKLRTSLADPSGVTG
jgi:RNA polymerase sigma-70 factor (ECF subfamily)